MEKTNIGMESNEMLQAQTLLLSHTFSYVDSMSLKSAVELGIPDAIDSNGGSITLPELQSLISIPPTKTLHLKRLMRLLTHLGIFAVQTNDKEVHYSLTPLSRLLVKNEGAKLSKFVTGVLHPIIVGTFQSMSSWLKDDEETAFPLVHGCSAWEMAGRNPEYNKAFNEAMASDAQFLMKVVVEDCGQVFRGITSLVDVGGGTGSSARAISVAFPEIKCSVLDLPQVVEAVHDKGTVDFVAGDMFNHIPPASAILLKWILHDWNDEECVRILKRCKEAIPSREEGGKVIIIDMVVRPESSHKKTTESQLYFDVVMMVLHGGAEREEREWEKIFKEAGFSDYNIVHTLGVRSVIEVYP